MNYSDFVYFIKASADSQSADILEVDNDPTSPDIAVGFHAGDDYSKKNYLEFKYYYFLNKDHSLKKLMNSFLSENIPDINISDISDDVLKECANTLNKLLIKEEIIYLQRIVQINRSLIHENYYYDGKNFSKWADELYKKHFLEYENLSCEVSEKLNDELKTPNELKIPIKQVHIEKIEEVNAIRTSKKIGLNYYLSEHSFYKIIAVVNKTHILANSPKIGTVSFEEKVCQIISKEYDCQIVDFLKVISLDDEKILQVEAISNGSDPETLGEQDRYNQLQGISGSIFLIKDGDEKSFVGTNDVANDLRISKSHKKQYETSQSITLKNYWIFPIFKDKELFGAIRVVNKRNAEFWSYHERKEIAYLVKALTPSLTQKRFIFNGLSLRGMYDILIEEWRINIKNFGFSLRFVEYITSIVHKKEEKNSLGISVCVINEDFAIETHVGEYVAVGTTLISTDDFESLSQLNEYAIYVQPEMACFTFRTSGNYVGCYRMANPEDNLSENSVKKFSKQIIGSRGHLLYIGRSKKNIRTYHNGQILGDIYLQEDSGLWKYRDYKELLDKSKNYINNILDDDDLEKIFILIWRLSSDKIGSILAVTKSTLEAKYIEKSRISPNNLTLINASYEEIADIASIDGAVLINRNLEIYKAGVIILATENNSPNKSAALGGSRHNAGKSLAKASGDAIVFVISENGGISLYYNDIEVYKRV